MGEELLVWLQHRGELTLGSGLALSLVFVLGAFVLFPRTFLCLGVGALFGPAAILIIVPSTTLGGVLAFLLARYLFAERLQRRLSRRPLLRAIADAVDSEGWRVVALLRLGSPLPSAAQNYLFGVTRIGLWPFAAASFLFTMPQAILYVYLGHAGRAALIEDASSTLSRVLLGIALLTLATALIIISRKARLVLRRTLPAV